jgi:hypothetical protein
MFVDGAVTLFMTVFWSEIGFESKGWGAQALWASGLIVDAAESMPELLQVALSASTEECFALADAKALAARYATKDFAAMCLRISQVIPNLFDGPNAEEERRKAECAWRELHGASWPPPVSGNKPPASGPRPAVTLRGQADAPIVRGKEMPRLTVARYCVVKALVDAGNDGLSTDDLVSKSGCGGAVNTLKALVRSSPEWGAVIALPGAPGLRYRIRSIDGS